MSKPGNIPNDVWVRAREALSDSTGIHPNHLDPDYLDCMAHHMHEAILAERERCALIAEMHEHRGVIAQAIRQHQVSI